MKTSTNHGLLLKKVHRVIKFNQKAWLKLYIDMKKEHRRKWKNELEKDFSKLMRNGKTMQFLENHGKYEKI